MLESNLPERTTPTTRVTRITRVTWLRVSIAMGLCLPAAALWAQLTPVYLLRLERPNAAQLETDVSGRANGAGHVLQIDRAQPLHELGTTEYLDRPAGVTAHFSAPYWDHEANGWNRNATRAMSQRQSWRHPSINLPTGQTSSMHADIYEDAPPGVLRFVRGVAVCPTSGALTNNDRIKGIRLYWGTLPPGATSTRQLTTRPNDYAQFRRANCNDNNWLPAQMCPSGQVATGAKVHSMSDGAVGIQLLCDQLAVMTDDQGRAEFARLNPGGSSGGVRAAFPDRPTEVPGRTERSRAR